MLLIFIYPNIIMGPVENEKTSADKLLYFENRRKIGILKPYYKTAFSKTKIEQ